MYAMHTTASVFVNLLNTWFIFRVATIVRTICLILRCPSKVVIPYDIVLIFLSFIDMLFKQRSNQLKKYIFLLQ